MTLPELLKKTVEMQGSDLHITISTPPQVRVHGHLQRLEGAEEAERRSSHRDRYRFAKSHSAWLDRSLLRFICDYLHSLCQRCDYGVGLGHINGVGAIDLSSGLGP